MPKERNNQSNLSKKFFNKKIPFEDIPIKTVKITLHALRWIFLLIFLFITIGIFILFISGGESYIQAILGYSITGFFTFFMGYFGWILAQSVINILVGKDNKEHSLSYYVNKKDKFRF